MAGTSNKSACDGETPAKPNHHFSINPPTTHSIDERSLGNYRLKRYQNEPDGAPLGHVQGRGPSNDQATRLATRQSTLISGVDTILSRLR
ncbi:hypothetical protein F4818DRAFT_219792 [Hypoxylon cercidicola]|nr:hypothetical protein F4818DRAFT_219792 [Hypoxylon cercidicola]